MTERRLWTLLERFGVKIGALGSPRNDDLTLPRPVAPPEMSRRGFLQLLGVGAAAVVAADVIDLERLLWVQQPMIVVPDMALEGGFNKLLSADWVTMEALRIMENNLKLTSTFNRQYEEQFARRKPLSRAAIVRNNVPFRWSPV